MEGNALKKGDHCYVHTKTSKNRLGTVYCFAYKCSSRKGGILREDGVSFHRFANKVRSPELYKRWVQNCKRGEPSQHALLCSKHFEEACFDRTGQTTRLREGAVPTKFVFPDQIKTKCVKPRKTQNSMKSKDRIPVAHFMPTSNNISQKQITKAEDRAKEILIAGNKEELTTCKPINLEQEHGYAIDNPTSLKKKMECMEQRMSKMSKELKNAAKREKRLRNAVLKYERKLSEQAIVISRLTENLNPVECLEGVSSGQVHIVKIGNCDAATDYLENSTVHVEESVVNSSNSVMDITSSSDSSSNGDFSDCEDMV